MTSNLFSVLQRIGQSFMLPIAVLPMAGIFLGVGGSFTNPTLIEAYHLTFLSEGTFLHSLLVLMQRCGLFVFANLPLLFAVGVAIGMTKTSKETGALSAVLGFLMLHTVIGTVLGFQGYTPENTTTDALIQSGIPSDKAFGVASLYTHEVGIFTLQIGIFGGIVTGLIAALITNRFSQTRLPDYLAFFSGNRLVAVMTLLVFIPIGAIFPFVWPAIFKGIVATGIAFTKMGYIGTFFYGFVLRILNVFGLHHAIYPLFWYTPLGGIQEVGGQMVSGGQRIFFAQLSDPSVTHFSSDATRTMTGGFLPMMFGLPAAALAMYHSADPENRTRIKGILFSAAFTSFLTGITEPIEFTFLFVAPVLYVIHALMEGLSYMLMHLLNVAVGITFSRGLIDFTFFGLMQGMAKTSYQWILILGPLYAVFYYVVFRVLIKALNLKTPGREGAESRLYTRSDFNEKQQAAKNLGEASQSDLILSALGGLSNVESIDACITRLRVIVKDPLKVEPRDYWLKELGAKGLFVSGSGVQVIYGPMADVYKNAILSQYPSLEKGGR